MKILIFEYITGGGFNRQELPTGLIKEGRLMLQALLANFAELEPIELTVMLDSRLASHFDTEYLDTVIISPEQNPHEVFNRLIAECDAVWPIAPEFDGILQNLCLAVAAQAKVLLAPPAGAVALTGNKYFTYQRLIENNIATVLTQLSDQAEFTAGEWIIKPIDGAGCGDSFILTNPEDFADHAIRSAQFIIQPHLNGDKTSLSCLFKNGECWIVSVNKQGFKIIERQYQLTEIIVNSQPISENYQKLAGQIAQAFPELWGYVGIDLIETAEEIRVLEINPRLTTSFAAIQAALGLNIAQLTLQLLYGQPVIKPTINQAITLNLH
ncbi:MAG: ATP-grasp domain-containing protein [Methylovulum sp.]|uniref:ATP-grasp domain-containing protein n=1 Tax=Methylovulum sp. TaxID=1916980 RepID=UPI002610C55B|nr:ATP-grasp domain-containing protein [Methylovulum sp.]MDD2724551.1 ATP-grasp domain-containing protein [Methylovulum sp.]MDD5123956.1 ATP-grasp domain-containing protein [Methylovulum sp.]